MLDRLETLLGPRGLLRADTDLARYVTEPRGRFQGRPLAVARPANTAQVAELVGLCAGQGVALVPQGGHTGLVGGGSALGPGREVIVSLERMRAVRALDTADASLIVEAGATLAAVREAAAEAGLMYPVSLASEGTATIGGTIASNAGGNLTIRHGNTRRQVLGLEVVLADGRILDGLRTLRKDNSGFDLKHWFIGSEGTLGIITAAALALQPPARQSTTALLAVADLEAGLSLLAELRSALGETLSACEFLPRQALDFVLADLPDARDPFDRPHPWYVLVQADSTLAGDWLEPAVLEVCESGLGAGRVGDAVVADSATRAAELWRLREHISPAQKRGGVSLKHDISVPVARIPAFMASVLPALERAVPGVRPCVFGHLGDGNLHFNLSQPPDMTAQAFRERESECNRIVFDTVVAERGSIAAEHGVGVLRRERLAEDEPLKVALRGRVKRALDPGGVMNPGKVVLAGKGERLRGKA